MSYSFIMTFKEINRSDLPAYILELMRFNREHVREILENNAAFIPSIFWLGADTQSADGYQKSSWKEADREWAYRLFSTRFLYWTDKDLLGIAGPVLTEFDPSLKEVHFQNKTDQDYELSDWSGIKLFEDTVAECRSASVKRLRKLAPGLGYMPDEEIVEDIEYYRRSTVYSRIFEVLGLDSYIFEKETDRFVSFSTNALVYDHDMYKMYSALESARRKYLEEEI